MIYRYSEREIIDNYLRKMKQVVKFNFLGFQSLAYTCPNKGWEFFNQILMLEILTPVHEAFMFLFPGHIYFLHWEQKFNSKSLTVKLLCVRIWGGSMYGSMLKMFAFYQYPLDLWDHSFLPPSLPSVLYFFFFPLSFLSLF